MHGDNQDIHLIDDWPKVPFLISYKNGLVHRWGHSVKFYDDELLEPNSADAISVEPVLQSDEPPRTVGRSEAEVVYDYIREIWKFTIAQIQSHQGYVLGEFPPIKVVIAVPELWNEVTKVRMTKAAAQAVSPCNVVMVTATEAAVLTTARTLGETSTLQVGFVVIAPLELIVKRELIS